MSPIGAIWFFLLTLILVYTAMYMFVKSSQAISQLIKELREENKKRATSHKKKQIIGHIKTVQTQEQWRKSSIQLGITTPPIMILGFFVALYMDYPIAAGMFIGSSIIMVTFAIMLYDMSKRWVHAK